MTPMTFPKLNLYLITSILSNKSTFCTHFRAEAIMIKCEKWKFKQNSIEDYKTESNHWTSCQSLNCQQGIRHTKKSILVFLQVPLTKKYTTSLTIIYQFLYLKFQVKTVTIKVSSGNKVFLNNSGSIDPLYLLN